MNDVAHIALTDFAGALASGRPLDFDAAFGMARTAAGDPAAVSQATGGRFSDPASAEDFLVREFLDRQSAIEADMALRTTEADVNDSDREVSDAAFAYAGLTDDDVRRMQADAAAGDPSAAIRVSQKFYFG